MRSLLAGGAGKPRKQGTACGKRVKPAGSLLAKRTRLRPGDWAQGESKTYREHAREAFTLFLRAVPCPQVFLYLRPVLWAQALARRLLLDARAGDVVLCAANMKTKGAHGMDGTAVVTGGAGGIGKRLAIYHNDPGWTLNPASEKCPPT